MKRLVKVGTLFSIVMLTANVTMAADVIQGFTAADVIQGIADVIQGIADVIQG